MKKRQIPKAVFEPWDGIEANDLLDTPQLVELVKKDPEQSGMPLIVGRLLQLCFKLTIQNTSSTYPNRIGQVL